MYETLGAPDRARSVFERVLEADSRLLLARYHLAELYIDQGNTGQALQLLEDGALPCSPPLEAPGAWMVQPDWQVAFLMQRLPLEAVPPVAQEIGVALPSLRGWSGLLSAACPRTK